MDKILIIDDSVSFLHDVEALLRSRYDVVTASSPKQGLEILETESVSAVLLDLKMPEMHGTEVLTTIRTQIDPHLPVIIVTDQKDVDVAVKAMQLGAYDFIPKSFNLDMLTAKIVKALERRSLEINVSALRNSQAEQYDRLLVASEPMKKMQKEVTRLAGMNFDVLLIGETGVGKDLIAFELHRRGPRADKPFIPVPMRTLNETLIESELFGHEKGAFSGADRAKPGKLESADGGTIYIPEISSLSESIQLKLLHFMQYKTFVRVGQDPRRAETRVDVRMVMATNESLEELVRKGTMREDFYHRITGVRLAIPALRDRKEDIELLARAFVEKFTGTANGSRWSIAPEVIEAMNAYRWPGNVRELGNMVKHAIAFSTEETLGLKAFPYLTGGMQQEKKTDPASMTVNFPETLLSYKQAEALFKRAYLEEALRRSDNTVSKAAALTGLTPQGYRKLLRSISVILD